jgi:hypothetical protein
MKTAKKKRLSQDWKCSSLAWFPLKKTKTHLVVLGFEKPKQPATHSHQQHVGRHGTMYSNPLTLNIKSHSLKEHVPKVLPLQISI